MHRTIGIFAHVDSGKTTLTERLLYETGRLRRLGQVDNGTSVMDNHAIEQKRGITVFTDQSSFCYAENQYHIIDTPGHVDFSAETERAIAAVDCAILLVSGSSGVQAHTITLFHLLMQYQIPTIFFISKTDLPNADIAAAIAEIRTKLTPDCFLISENTSEFAAEREESFLESYLADAWTPQQLTDTLVQLVHAKQAFPIVCGSARTGTGIAELLEALRLYTPPAPTTKDFEASVYKVRYDAKNTRVTFLKIQSGTLTPRTEFRFQVGEEIICEKIGELRLYHGAKFEPIPQAETGQIVGVTGLQTAVCGTILRTDSRLHAVPQSYQIQPVLQARVIVPSETPAEQVSQALRVLKAEDPALAVTYEKQTAQFLVHVMGRIQLEILEQVLTDRFHIAAAFAPPEIAYRETIAETVMGIGHFEPLRHYAEVQLQLAPAPRGSGITFRSKCPTDILPLQYQHLVEAHIFEKQHCGVLTGAPLTDVQITLLCGRAHEKHTEGGDFREATYRAIRHALMQAHSILLEPFYQMDFYIPEDAIGRVLSDIPRLRGQFDPPETLGAVTHIHARGPAVTFMQYAEELAAFTHGTGSVSMTADGYASCENAEEVISQIGYDAEHDTENPAFSIFCAHGAGYPVPWQEVAAHSHILHKS